MDVRPRVIDLFAGAGGFSLGFRQAGFESVFAIDNDPHAARTYARNFGDHVICGDIRLIEQFPEADVVIGGPPCQGFSRLGKKTHGKPTTTSFEGNGLWVEYMRCVEQVQPKMFVVENVPDFFKHFAWDGIRREAKRLGYQLAHGILNAADFGVAQRRQRAFIIGSRIGKPYLPAPTHAAEPGLFDLEPWRTVRDAIGDLPIEPDNVNRHDFRNASELSIRRYMAIPEGGNRKNLPDELNLPCWLNKSSKSGGSADLMGRLRWDQAALTIRTEFLKPEKGRYLHPQAHRSITVREGARLQSFPDDFVFEGSNYQVVRQIGNAVPVLLSRRIAEAVMAQLTGLNLRAREQSAA
jgi:DNA (cytosine-5)-methyltransferase 1